MIEGLPEPNWDVITDLGLKAADDANAALGRTVFLASDPLEATLVSLVAFSILRARHDAVKEAMRDSLGIGTAIEMADAVYEEVKASKGAELKVTLPVLRAAVSKVRRGG